MDWKDVLRVRPVLGMLEAREDSAGIPHRVREVSSWVLEGEVKKYNSERPWEVHGVKSCSAK